MKAGKGDDRGGTGNCRRRIRRLQARTTTLGYLTSESQGRMIAIATGVGGRTLRPATAGKQGIRCDSGTVPPL